MRQKIARSVVNLLEWFLPTAEVAKEDILTVTPRGIIPESGNISKE